MAKKDKKKKVKKSDVSESSKKAARSFRTRDRRRTRRQKLNPDFDWSTVRMGGCSLKREDYPYRSSCKCLRESENTPMTNCDDYAIHWKEKTKSGKLRWYQGFLKRSHRDMFVKECPPKRKARKEADFIRP